MKRRPSCWTRQCLIFPSALQPDGQDRWVSGSSAGLLRASLPEGDGEGVVFAAFPHQEGSVPGDAHQHVFGLDAGQAGVEPPAGGDGASAGLRGGTGDGGTYSLLSWALGWGTGLPSLISNSLQRSGVSR